MSNQFSAGSPTSFASLGRRLGALAIDNLALMGILLATYGLVLLTALVGGGMLEMLVLASILQLVVVLAWSVLQWKNLATRGQTLGKRVVHVWVLDEATGTPIGWGRAFLRILVLWLVALFVLPLIIMAVLMANDPKRRGWHDQAAGSVVVHAMHRPAAQPTATTGSSSPSTLAPMTPSGPPQVSLASGYAASPPPAPLATPPQAMPAQTVSPTPSLAGSPVVAPPPGIAPLPRGVAPQPVMAPAEHRVDVDDKTRAAPSRQVPGDPHWRLVATDGSQVIVVKQAVVVGRQPREDLVPAAAAVVIDDPQRSTSKTHAALRIIGGALEVEDLDSTNGVYVGPAGAETRLAPRTPTAVADGSQVSFGDCRFAAERVS